MVEFARSPHFPVEKESNCSTFPTLLGLAFGFADLEMVAVAQW
jgi:hypothetical protein